LSHIVFISSFVIGLSVVWFQYFAFFSLSFHFLLFIIILSIILLESNTGK